MTDTMSVTNGGDAPARVLVVDPAEAESNRIEHALAPWSDSALAETVATLQEGLAALQRGHFDVVIAALDLRTARGVDVIRKIRPAARGVPIVAVTSSGGDHVGMVCLAAGAEDYVARDDLRPIPLRRTLSYARARTNQAEIDELRVTLDRYRDALSRKRRPSQAPPAADGTMAHRQGELADAIAAKYRGVLDQYLHHLAQHTPRPTREMDGVANDLVDLGAGPRDLIGIHVKALERAVRESRPELARTYAIAARLLALEMMGRLAKRYRACRQPSYDGPLPPELRTR